MSNISGRFAAVALGLVFSVTIVWADILVNINLNKPIYDVSEQFVSFSIPPELLFDSLDGRNKKTITDMAALLGPSYLKLNGDFFFPTDLKSNLKNPTQSIWSGFNRWTRAMNWTMVIPVQYTPFSWDPIDALRVLNISNTVGIDSCIWQLGLDFAASRAADYAADLNTLDTMVDTFRPYVNNWKVIGADITAGSSAEETKRYIDMSRDVNTAFGWTQPAGYHIEENVNGYIYDKDLSLKAMMEKKVPVWLSIPPRTPTNQMSNGYTTVDVSEGIRWAQALGDAASSGFDVVFKPLTMEDVATPSYSFYVTALFKKIMGNRVFSAKPVKRSPYSSKLYTHCANGIAGGVAFMGINTEDYPIKISARLTAKFTGSEVWQFILTSKKGAMYLNNEELALNSTLEPFVRIKNPNKPLALSLPPMSVGFWVLPLANHEDCQFTELLSSFNQEAQWESRQRKQTSSDRLLKKLILETSLTDQMKNRRRRDSSTNDLNKASTLAKGINRHRRFILQESPLSDLTASKTGLQFALQERNLKKREDAHNWFKTLVLNPVVIPKVDWSLKRSRRGTDFLTSLFPNENIAASKHLHSAFNTKQKYNDEASIFKESANIRELDIPKGDVHFQYITDADGEEINLKGSHEELEEEKHTKLPVRELPSEFYEIIADEKYQPRPIVDNLPSKSKNQEISGIEGYTKYMTRNHLRKQTEKEETTTPPSSSDEQDNSKRIFGTEFTLHHYPTLEANDDSEKYPAELDESESLRSFLPTTARRSRRSIEFGQLKSIHDNLINKDDDVQPLSYLIPDVIDNFTEKSVVDSNAAADMAANVKSHVSKILSAVKTHLSGFFNSFVN